MAGGTRQKSGLTAAWVKRAKPKDKPYKLSDRDGLYLMVEPSGSRVWRMNYRMSGRQRTMARPEIRSASRMSVVSRCSGRGGGRFPLSSASPELISTPLFIYRVGITLLLTLGHSYDDERLV